jgi:trk system potassium uptake protein
MINWRALLHVLSFIVMVVSLFMAATIAVALFYGERLQAAAFAAVSGGSLVLFGTLLLLTRSRKQFMFTTRDGFLLVSLSWAVVSAVGALPFVISSTIPNFTEAYFETMSGFTTTGATILTAVEQMPYSLLFWRSLTHWLGGMGIVVLVVAIMPLIGIGGMPLIQAESPGPRVDKIVPKVRETAKILWIIYIGLSVLETVLLLLGGMNLFDAVTHTFGTMATGGFSPKNASVGHYGSPYITVVITLFMIFAGVNFGLYFALFRRQWSSLKKNTELRAYLFIFAAATLLIWFSLRKAGFYTDTGENLLHAGFQTASILTTTGYATVDFDLWPGFAKSVLFVLMFIGGSSGSTGGGIKVIRIMTLVKLSLKEMRYLLNPRGIHNMKINGETVRKDMVFTVAGFIFLYTALLFIITLAAAFSGIDLLSSLSTALVTLGNIGPGFGLVGPALNFHFMEPWLKWLLSAAMMIGRLEVYTVLIVLTPSFWRK